MTVAVATELQRPGRDWNRNLRLLRQTLSPDYSRRMGQGRARAGGPAQTQNRLIRRVRCSHCGD